MRKSEGSDSKLKLWTKHAVVAALCAFAVLLAIAPAATAQGTTEFTLVAILGARAEIYIFPMAKLVPNLVAGFLSGFTTLFVLRAFERSMPRREESSAEPDSRIADASGDRAETRIRPRAADAASRVP